MEEFYDSLEDNFSSASSSSIPSSRPHLNSEIWETVELPDDYVSTSSLVIIKPPNLIPKRHPSRNSLYVLEKEFSDKCKTKSKTESNLIGDISSIVPLYDGERNRSEIKRSRKSSSSPMLNQEEQENEERKPVTQDDSYTPNKNLNRNQKLHFKSNTYEHKPCNGNRNLQAIASKIPLKSYLGMFHARIGYPGVVKKDEPKDTVRSVFGDSYRTEISDIPSETEEFADAEDDRSDTTSFYLNQIEEDRQTRLSSTSHDNFNSVSEVMSNDKSLGNRTSRPRKVKTNPPPVPVLGGLGPNIGSSQEKLERRQRQLKYGQKASYRNRIKQMEIKVLKNLKNEIRESSFIDEKQEEQM